MKRRIYVISIALCFVVFSLLISRGYALALTATPSRTPTAIITPTSTAFPGAEFTGTPLTGDMPLTVQFTHLNFNFISSCLWTFGDGATQSVAPTSSQTSSVCPSVSHTYTVAGSYTVSLRVTKATNGFSSTVTKPNYIVVTDPSVPTATATRTSLPGCGTRVVVTSTPSPTFTPTPRTATATSTACGPIYITATPGTPVVSGADLVISSITYAGSNPSCANAPKNNVVVTNNGTVAAGTFQVSYSAGGVAQPAQTVSGLAAGQSVTLQFSSASGAGMVVTATADSTNVIAETNETNNTNSATLPIPTQAPTCTPTPVITVITPTPTLTLTRTPTVFCGFPTAALLTTVSPVTSPTNATTQVITVPLSGGISITVISEAGTFTSTTSVNNVFSVTVDLVPNSVNHLHVQGQIAVGSCTYNTSSTTIDKNGNPLTIVQGTVALTPTPTRSATPNSNTCSPVTAVIASPFVFDGAGTFCWQSSNLGTYINSWNATSVTINGVNISNLYVPVASYPAKIGGYWYVGYSSSVAWGHFEAK
jgi:PKD repeat protein